MYFPIVYFCHKLLKMNKYTFILSDESVNSYGQIILTDGINTERFAKNPVMLYMHERNTVIGRWDNIRKEDKKLLADAFFDANIELARTVKAQVDNGVLRAVSIGVNNAEVKTVNGVETIVKCELQEASLVDIPANANAIKLKNKSKMLKFTCYTEQDNNPNPKNTENSDILSQIKALLGLDEDCTDEDVLKALEALKSSITEQHPDSVNRAHRLNLITNSDLKNYSYMDKGGKKAFLSFCDKLIGKEKEDVRKVVEKGLADRKFVHSERVIFQELGENIGLEKLKKILNCMSGAVRCTDLISINANNRSNWGLTEYRKFAPDELNENPELYQFLLEKENQPGGKSLEWYRKNDPDYLKKNPKEYKRLLEEEKNKR